MEEVSVNEDVWRIKRHHCRVLQKCSGLYQKQITIILPISDITEPLDHKNKDEIRILNNIQTVPADTICKVYSTTPLMQCSLISKTLSLLSSQLLTTIIALCGLCSLFKKVGDEQAQVSEWLGMLIFLSAVSLGSSVVCVYQEGLAG